MQALTFYAAGRCRDRSKQQHNPTNGLLISVSPTSTICQWNSMWDFDGFFRRQHESMVPHDPFLGLWQQNIVYPGRQHSLRTTTTQYPPHPPSTPTSGPLKQRDRGHGRREHVHENVKKPASSTLLLRVVRMERVPTQLFAHRAAYDHGDS